LVLRRFTWIGCVVLLCACGQSLAAGPRYVVTDLGTAVGAGVSYGWAVNEQGQVTGRAYISGGAYSAFVWDGSTARTLGTLGGTFSTGRAINDSSRIVGDSTPPNSQGHVFLYDGAQMTDVNVFSATQSSAAGVNSLTQITGYYALPTGQSHAFVTSGGGGGGSVIDLGTLSGYAASEATGINDSGVVVGNAYQNKYTLARRAWIYDSVNGMRPIGTLGGWHSEALAVNSSGEIVGDSYILPYTATGNSTHAFLYQSNTMIDLGTLGGITSVARAINDTDQIVGSSTVANGQTHAFLYENGSMLDLNSLIAAGSGMVLSDAAGISNTGLIAGTALVGNNPHAVLLSPVSQLSAIVVPEPAALWPVASCAVLFRRRGR
jgi:probable HAF family extracellular repeat protein